MFDFANTSVFKGLQLSILTVKLLFIVSHYIYNATGSVLSNIRHRYHSEIPNHYEIKKIKGIDKMTNGL